MRTLALLLIAAFVSPALAAEDSPMVKLLKSGKVPEDRQGTIIEMLGKRGTQDELGFIFEKTLDPKGFSPKIRLKAVSALSEAALTREKTPAGDLGKLAELIDPKQTDNTLRLSAIELAGLWKVADLIDPLTKVAIDEKTTDATRLAAFGALATIGKPALKTLNDLADPKVPYAQRRGATIALAKVDLPASIKSAVGIIAEAKSSQELVAVLSPIVSRGGAKTLADSLTQASLPADPARRALSALYALGRSDDSLVAVLNKLAGINAEVKALSQADLMKMVIEVEAKGSPVRGEQIFRRADLNCIKCHAVAGAAGGVGPELSAIGGSSPVDYLINSIMLPDQAIKEEFHTKIIALADGQVLQGIVVDKDDNRWIIKEATGDLKTIPAADVEETKDGGSLMPKGLVNLLTKDEFLDLVKFLSLLGKPGKYEIHSTPTIQRWRVLKPVPEALSQAIPNDDTFDVEVLKADPTRWLPAYALVPGTIPLTEFTELAGSPILYLQGELNVTADGVVTFPIEDKTGVTLWVDNHLSEDLKADLETGKHPVTLRVDTAARGQKPLMVEILKAEGSGVEFTVVGGR